MNFDCLSSYHLKVPALRLLSSRINDLCLDKEIKYLVESKGGKLINIERLRKKGTKLSIECKFGHRWDTARLHHIKKGIWCPECGLKKLAEHFKDSSNVDTKTKIDAKKVDTKKVKKAGKAKTSAKVKKSTPVKPKLKNVNHNFV